MDTTSGPVRCTVIRDDTVKTKDFSDAVWYRDAAFSRSKHGGNGGREPLKGTLFSGCVTYITRLRHVGSSVKKTTIMTSPSLLCRLKVVRGENYIRIQYSERRV